MTPKTRIVLVVASALISLASPLLAGPYTFTKVADTSTPVPSSTGNFANFYTNSRVSTDGATIVFTGAGPAAQPGQAGIYSYDMASHALARVADWTTLIPGSANAFYTLSEPSVYDGRVGFYGTNPYTGEKGVYTATTTGTGLMAIANLSTAMPGGPGNFAAFDRPSLQGGNLAFYGVYAGNSWSGIYTAADTGGTITKIVDRATMIPGDSNVFNSLGRPSISGSSVAFWGGYSGGSFIRDGIYSAPVSGGAVTWVASEGMTAPGGAQAFTEFYSPTTDGTYVAFDAKTLSTDAVSGLWRYTLDGTEGIVIADKNTVIPGHGTTKFETFWGISMSSGIPVFNGGTFTGVGGIYAYADGNLVTIIEKGDTLDGKTVSYAKVYDQSVIGDMDLIAFYATFTDGSAGIYAAQVPLAALGVVPEPATLTLLALGGAALLRRGRKRA